MHKYQTHVQQCVSAARDKIHIRPEPSEDSVWQVSTLRQNLHQGGESFGSGVTEPSSVASEKMAVQGDCS